MEKLYSQLPDSKIKIYGSKNPIPMKLFLSFLTVEVQKQTDFLGNDCGWTRYTGDNDLVISGGIMRNVEYLDHILYGDHLNNPYNHFVNPFYLFPIMREKGKKFFANYYKSEILKLKKKAEDYIEDVGGELLKAKLYEQELTEWITTFLDN